MEVIHRVARIFYIFFCRGSLSTEAVKQLKNYMKHRENLKPFSVTRKGCCGHSALFHCPGPAFCFHAIFPCTAVPAALILAVMSAYTTHNSKIHTEAVASVGLYGCRASSDTTLP